MELIDDAVQRSDWTNGRAHIVAQNGRQQVGCGADDGDRSGGGFEGQSTVILEQNDAFFGGFERDLAVPAFDIRGEANGIERAGALRIEEAELDARGIKTLSCLGDKLLGDQFLADRIGQGVEAGGPDAA